MAGLTHRTLEQLPVNRIDRAQRKITLPPDHFFLYQSTREC